MAITKLLRIRERAGGHPSAGLKNCLEYICDYEKTNEGRLIRGNAGGTPDVIYTNMVLNKRAWQKERGSQGFHHIISWSPEEDVPENLALQVAEEYCRELLQNQYLYTIAFHRNSQNPHCHIVFDSVNFQTGKIFQSPRYDWTKRIQPLTDRICRKYGLDTLSIDPAKERVGKYHTDWEETRNDGSPRRSVSWNDIIRDDIDEVLRNIGETLNSEDLSPNDAWDLFLSRLAEMKYEFRADGRYLSLKPWGKEKFVRSVRLGPGYSKEELQRRIREPKHSPQSIEGYSYKVYGDSVPIYRAAVGCYHRKKSYSPLQRQYYRRFGRLSHIRNNKVFPIWKYKKELTRLGAITDQLEYLFNHDITDLDGIRARLQELQKDRGTEAARERKLLRKMLSDYQRCNDPDDILNEPSAYEPPLPTPDSIRQIWINRILFRDVDLSKETFLVRIPGTQSIVRLYSADSRLYNQGDKGEQVSSYIYPEAEYCLVNESGTVLSRITGTELAKHFKSREVTRKEGDGRWKR